MRARPVLVSFSLLLLVALPSAARVQSPSASPASIAGTWDGTFEPPGSVGGDPCSLLVELKDTVHVELLRPQQRTLLEGTFDAEAGVLRVGGGPGEETIELRLRDGALVGLGSEGSRVSGFRLRHTSDRVLERNHDQRVVELAGRERPEDFSQVGLELEAGFLLDELVRKVAERYRAVGLSVACVVDGALVDVRCLGWEDFFADVPVSPETRYRWASISKPLTATTALRMAAAGTFELDADVRSWVPEFPDKGAVITPRRILCHQSGIVHYDGAVRTWRDYTEPHPFERLANGLDLFREAPLLAPPGTIYSYSTHAWTLLGLAMERAGKKPYHELVRAQVLEPLGMASTEPDHPSRAIAHRTKGYEHAGELLLLETLEDDVSWKLPGGGWTSTVADLARFGAGLLGSGLLDDEQKALAWTRQTVAGGTQTDVGLGFFVGTLDVGTPERERLVSHSGGQRKASTYLALLPDRGLAVAAMCNTDGAPMEEIALGGLRILLASRK